MEKDLKKYLNGIYKKYNKKHSSKDPVWNLHELSTPEDIETAGLFLSSFAIGKVECINSFYKKFADKIDNNFYEFIGNFGKGKVENKIIAGLKYRFYTEDDISLFLYNMGRIIREHGSIGSFFAKHYQTEAETILHSLTELSKALRKGSENMDSFYSHLIPSSENNSACKRLNLYFRWMVRKDEIDLGIWSDNISKSKLIIPVDIHIYRGALNLGLVARRTADMKFALELTDKLSEFDKHDPVKYDFAICHLGIDKEKIKNPQTGEY